jgi:hypothetical protein
LVVKLLATGHDYPVSHYSYTVGPIDIVLAIALATLLIGVIALLERRDRQRTF